MIPFSIRGGVWLACQANFTFEPYLNIDFLESEGPGIPLHLSLRRDEGVLVVNRRDAEGWRRELRFPFAAESGAGWIETRFQGESVTIALDGQHIGRFDRLPRPDRAGRFGLRRGFPRLAAIRFLRLQGGWASDGLRIEAPLSHPAPGPALSDRLELVWTGTEGPVRIAETGIELAAAEAERGWLLRPGRGQDFAALLPGRIWDGGHESLTLQLGAAGLRLGKGDLAARIEALLASGRPEYDSVMALQLIEHAHHARLLDHLSSGARQSLLGLAAGYGLGDFLTAGQTLAVVPATPLPAPDPLQSTRDRFTATLRRNPAQDPVALLQALQDETPLPAEDRRQLLLGLAEWFATHHDPRALASLFAAEGHAPPEPNGDPWHDTSALPFLFVAGRLADCAAVLNRSAQERRGWLITPAIAWVATEAARGGGDLRGLAPQPAETEALLWAFTGFVEGQATDYWGRARCRALTGALVELIALGPALPDPLARSLGPLALRVFGLAPEFWEAARTRGLLDSPAAPPALSAAAQAFARLQALSDGPRPFAPETREAIDTLLQVFETADCHDAAQARRDLLGPSGCATRDGALPPPGDLPRLSLDPDEALLRHLAFPRAAPLQAGLTPALNAALGRAIAEAWNGVPRSPRAGLQELAARQAMALIAGNPGARDIADFTRLLTGLNDGVAGFLGPALGLSVAAALAPGPAAEALVERVLAMLAALPEAERAALAQAPAPRMAAARLARAGTMPAASARLAALLPPLPAPSGAPLADDLAARANPLFDTLVAIYTCRAHLDSRIAAIRGGWLRDLEALGVPWLVFTGDGEGQRVGDVVHLNAPDDYEGLPQKTLAMVRWVLEHTPFSYLLKVDDDCFLDAETHFLSLSALKSDYHGRPLDRVRGQMDRAWHMARARSDRGRSELDKSPEPSRYADGGSGYTLSRRAMAALVEMAGSPEGRVLAARSFMEDKLVGDLLARRGIRVSGEDHRVAILRRNPTGGALVPKWENGFLPFRGAGIRLAHLDGHERQAEVHAQSRRDRPLPGKLWPTYRKLRLGARSNALDLISAPARLEQVNAAPVAVVACLRNEAMMLPHFLAHYRRLGVEGFLIADNGSDDGTLDLLAEAPDVALFAVDTDYSQSHYGVAWQQALMANLREGRWSLVADADELMFWNADLAGSLPGLLAEADFASADAARVFMLDLYPEGPLAGADFTTGPFAEAGSCEREPFLAVSGGAGPFSNAPVYTSALRHRLIPGSRADLFVAQKLALLRYRPWMRLTAGLHFAAGVRVAPRDLLFGHFKYNAAFRAKTVTEVARRQHFNDAEEYRKYLALAAEGRDVIHDPAHSVAWQDCATVRRILREGRIGF